MAHVLFEVDDHNVVIDIITVSKMKYAPLNFMEAKSDTPELGLTWFPQASAMQHIEVPSGFHSVTTVQVWTQDSVGQIVEVRDALKVGGVVNMGKGEFEVTGTHIPVVGEMYQDGVFVPFVMPKPTHEQQLSVIRAERNEKLAASDWTQVPDVNAALREAWAVYRQQLRDITSQPDLYNIVWPVEPN